MFRELLQVEHPSKHFRCTSHLIDRRDEGLLIELRPVESPYSGSPGHERGREPMSPGFIKNALVFPVPDYSR